MTAYGFVLLVKFSFYILVCASIFVAIDYVRMVIVAKSVQVTQSLFNAVLIHVVMFSCSVDSKTMFYSG